MVAVCKTVAYRMVAGAALGCALSVQPNWHSAVRQVRTFSVSPAQSMLSESDPGSVPRSIAMGGDMTHQPAAGFVSGGAMTAIDPQCDWKLGASPGAETHSIVMSWCLRPGQRTERSS